MNNKIASKLIYTYLMIHLSEKSWLREQLHNKEYLVQENLKKFKSCKILKKTW